LKPGLTSTAEALLAAAEKAVSVAEERVAGAQARARAVQEQIAVTRKALEDSMQAKAEEVAVREKITKLENEISEWSYIRDACSKTGLQALEIDGVCPAITCDSNNLLTQTFGTGFSVRIETKDESGREVFKVYVIREDGSEDLFDEYSGGEKIWILKALRLALTLLSKQKSNRAFLAAFADEEDGGLDGETARNFVGLYRSFLQIGGFESFFTFRTSRSVGLSPIMS